MALKAVIYVRVGSQQQMLGDGPHRQERYCREFAQKMGVEVTHKFLDVDPGRTPDRTGLKGALKVLESGGASVLLVETHDRLFMDQEMLMPLLGLLREMGVQVEQCCPTTREAFSMMATAVRTYHNEVMVPIRDEIRNAREFLRVLRLALAAGDSDRAVVLTDALDDSLGRAYASTMKE